jgi:hypothetical protein
LALKSCRYDISLREEKIISTPEKCCGKERVSNKKGRAIKGSAFFQRSSLERLLVNRNKYGVASQNAVIFFGAHLILISVNRPDRKDARAYEKPLKCQPHTSFFKL